MNLFTLENTFIKIIVSSKGAELQSVINKSDSSEILWQANGEYWSRKAPVLFPFVGKLKENYYRYLDNNYPMGQHGFARDREFELSKLNENSIGFSLRSDTQSKSIYPFEFTLNISYELDGRSLITRYQLSNDGEGDMFFSIGSHPGFNVPLNDKGDLDNVYIVFDQSEESLSRHMIADGLQNSIEKRLSLEDDGKTLRLQHSDFEEDAIILKNLRSNKLMLFAAGKAKLELEFEGFPYFGIWTKPGAPFICLEPWCGLADYEEQDTDLPQKEGIETLSPKSTFERNHQINFI